MSRLVACSIFFVEAVLLAALLITLTGTLSDLPDVRLLTDASSIITLLLQKSGRLIVLIGIVMVSMLIVHHRCSFWVSVAYSYICSQVIHCSALEILLF